MTVRSINVFFRSQSTVLFSDNIIVTRSINLVILESMLLLFSQHLIVIGMVAALEALLKAVIIA